MGLKDIRYKSLYMLPKDNYVEEVLINSLKNATSVDCMFGFFGSDALRAIAPGLAEYLTKETESMRLVVSPNLMPNDISALREGINTPTNVLEARLKQILGEAKITKSALVNHTLTCLAYMLAHNLLQFKIIYIKDGVFHPKVWLFKEKNNTLVAHGSSNFTDSGLGKNHEQIRVESSWDGGQSKEAITVFADEYEVLWNGENENIYTMDLPVAIEKNLIQEYYPDRKPTTLDFYLAWEAENKTKKEPVENCDFTQNEILSKLKIPSNLDIFNGPFSHQGEAINAWESSCRRGILSMATGSGKTITALSAATRLQEKVDSLLIIISAPYKPLVTQWIEEINSFGLKPLPNKGTQIERAKNFENAVMRLKAKVSTVEVMVVTEIFLTSKEFRQILDKIPSSISTLLISDEVHNLGKKSFLTNKPNRFDFRLGLSATPERQYDQEGTLSLFEFFGNPVFEFTLEQAIGVCLVPYNYYIHKVHLTDIEFDKWIDITNKLRRKGFGGDEDENESGELPSDINHLLIARRKIIESAEEKIKVLKKLLINRTREDLKHTLVYATDKNSSQLKQVNNLLQNELNFTIHQLTSDETSTITRATSILTAFARGDYNVITCMKVLDEGVDIPQVSEVYLLASNTVRRQWIQRRGRVLRKCDAINKKLAYIHDFIVIPPNPSEKRAQAIIEGELDRVREFAVLSSNGGNPDGPFDKIESIMNSMYN